MSTLSETIRSRRKEAKLTLAEAARRAGTSAATFYRYENGWDRFELQTLNKLASALDCDLRITLTRRKRPPVKQATRIQTVHQIKRLFWDRPLTVADLDRHRVWVVERVLEYGQLEDVHALVNHFGKAAFLDAVSQARWSSAKTASCWKHLLKREGRTCTRTFSRNTAWNS